MEYLSLNTIYKDQKSQVQLALIAKFIALSLLIPVGGHKPLALNSLLKTESVTLLLLPILSQFQPIQFFFLNVSSQAPFDQS